MSKARWFKFYGNDFIGGTKGWTATERWGYLALLWACWESDDGTLEGDGARLRAMAEVDASNWARVKGRILSKFKVLSNGRIYNERLIEERHSAGLPCPRRIPPMAVLSNENNHAAVPHATLRARPRARARIQNPEEREIGEPLKEAPPISRSIQQSKDAARAPTPGNGQEPASARTHTEPKPKLPEPGPALPEEERAAFVKELLGRMPAWPRETLAQRIPEFKNGTELERLLACYEKDRPDA